MQAKKKVTSQQQQSFAPHLLLLLLLTVADLLEAAEFQLSARSAALGVIGGADLRRTGDDQQDVTTPPSSSTSPATTAYFSSSSTAGALLAADRNTGPSTVFDGEADADQTPSKQPPSKVDELVPMRQPLGMLAGGGGGQQQQPRIELAQSALRYGGGRTFGAGGGGA